MQLVHPSERLWPSGKARQIARRGSTASRACVVPRGCAKGTMSLRPFVSCTSKVDQLKELTMLALTKTSLQCANPSSQVRFP